MNFNIQSHRLLSEEGKGNPPHSFWSAEETSLVVDKLVALITGIEDTTDIWIAEHALPLIEKPIDNYFMKY